MTSPRGEERESLQERFWTEQVEKVLREEYRGVEVSEEDVSLIADNAKYQLLQGFEESPEAAVVASIESLILGIG